MVGIGLYFEIEPTWFADGLFGRRGDGICQEPHCTFSGLSLSGKGCCSLRKKTVGGTGLEDEDGLRNECTFLQAQDVYSIADRYYQ